jgi:outer membrane protein assembly factor BamB
MKSARNNLAIVATVSLVAVMTFSLWLWSPVRDALQPRVPGTDSAPGTSGESANPVLAGKVIPGPGKAAALTSAWPQFRGPNRDGIIADATRLSRDWKTSPPRELWSLDVGEGYAGVAIRAGRVYLLDYDRDAKQSALRCLSLADGEEIWRFSYPLTIKRNHGMTRTMPTLAGNHLVALDSKCNVFCLDASTGELKWSVSLVNEFGAAIPEWYAGQCPLVDGDKVILAPGGKNALLIALDLAMGKPLWQSPNPHDWKMTHSSIMPTDFGGRRHYVYCASKGVVGVDANDGKQLWETADWKISIATVPSPVPLPDGRIFLTGGYNAGSLMLELASDNSTNRSAGLRPGVILSSPPNAPGQETGAPLTVSSASNYDTNSTISVRSLFKLPANIFGATQHTPILKDNHLYGIRADGRFVCLGLDGKVVWSSGSGENFGLGSFLMAGDLIYALNDSGQLSLLEASSTQFALLGQIQPLTGRESWAPMALADGRLLLRDLTRLVCLDVSAK